MDMLYPDLFKSFEAVRWNMETDIPWNRFDGARLTEDQAVTIKMNAITEWAALPATEMFLRDNRDDSDFSAFISVWFFEEQKHSLVLIEYARRVRQDRRADGERPPHRPGAAPDQSACEPAPVSEGHGAIAAARSWMAGPLA